MEIYDIERMFEAQPDFPSEDFEGNALPTDGEIYYAAEHGFENEER